MSEKEKGRLRDFGALWNKESEKMGKYMSGEIEVLDRRIRIVVFSNKQKDSETQPDWRICIEMREDK